MARKKITNDEIISEYDSDYDDYCSGKSVADIAEERGVTRQTIYKYFRVMAEHYSDSLNQKRGCKPKDISKTIVRLYTKDYELWKNGKTSIKAVAEKHNNSRTTVYKYFRILENSKNDNSLHKKGEVMEHLYGYTEKGEDFIFDRKTARIPHALVIGKAGTGKTHMIQQEIVSNLLHGDSNDKIIVVDVNGEYKGLAEEYNGEIVNFTDTFINPCDLPLNSSQKIFMADFLISFSEIILGKECNAGQKAIISKAVSSMYNMYMYEVIKTDRTIKREECPTLASFYNKLRCYSKEREIEKLLIAIEPYCEGMFDCFANRTNINLDCRLIVIDLSSINIRRMALALHVTLMFLWSVLIENNSYSENTWIYFEDFHRYFKNPILTDTFLQIFKYARTKGGIITGITQHINISYPVLHTIENLILFSQNKSSAELLKEVYSIPDNLMNHITENTCKSGLMQFGRGEFIPFTQSVNEK